MSFISGVVFLPFAGTGLYFFILSISWAKFLGSSENEDSLAPRAWLSHSFSGAKPGQAFTFLLEKKSKQNRVPP